MLPSRSLARGAAALALAVALAVGCSAPEDEDMPSVARTTTPTSTVQPAEDFELPVKDPKVTLDPATQGTCDAIYEFQLFSFAVHTSSDRSETEVKRLIDGIKEHEAHVIRVLPERTAEIKILSADAQRIMKAPPTPGVTLAGEILTANGTLLAYLRETCKMID